MKKQSNWALVKETSNVQYFVSRQGQCKTVNLATGETKVFPGYYNEKTGYVQFAGGLVHRLVAKAFLPNPRRREQVHHINSDPRDNRLENLAWVTRRQNNGTPEARLRKSLAARRPDKSQRLIKAVSPEGQAFVFKSGYDCARFLGCSHVLVYNCLNGKVSAKHAKGWTLSWVPCGGFERLSAKLQAINEMIERHLDNIQKIKDAANAETR